MGSEEAPPWAVAEAGLRALWDEPGAEAPASVLAALGAAGVLDPWPWRRQGVRRVGPDHALTGAVAPSLGGPPVPLLLLPHRAGAEDDPCFVAFGDEARVEVASIPAHFGPELDGASLEERRALARAWGAGEAPVLGQGVSGLRWRAAFAAAGSRRPFVLVPHANPVLPYTARAALAAARARLPGDVVLAGSPAAAAPWRRLGFRVDPHYPFGVDARRLDADPAAVARVRALLGEAPALLYVGRLDADKNLPALLDAVGEVRRTRPVSLVIAWSGGHPAVARLVRDRAAALGGVRIVESPPPALFAALHAAATLAVTASTSPFETYGRAPVEALAAGLPLVAPDWGPFRAVCTEAVGYPVPVHTDTGLHRVTGVDLARTIERALADPEGLRTRAAAARERARDHTPAVRFRHAMAVVRASWSLPSGDPGPHALPAPWAALDRALTARAPVDDAVWEAIRADWFGGWAAPAEPAAEPRGAATPARRAS